MTGRLDETTEKIFMIAIEQFMDTGTCNVLCDACHSPIEFVKLSETVWEHHCKCGKYNGNLKGL
jgi:hypothetical protein